jgi:hypothetical protein
VNDGKPVSVLKGVSYEVLLPEQRKGHPIPQTRHDREQGYGAKKKKMIILKTLVSRAGSMNNDAGDSGGRGIRTCVVGEWQQA